MKYISWIWLNTKGIRWNTVIRILVGWLRVGLGLLMIWLSKSFIDVTIRKGTTQDIILMISMLVGCVLGGIILRQVYYYMTTAANIRQTNAIRLRIFGKLFTRQLFDEQVLHSGDISSRMAKDIEVVSDASTSILPQMIVTGIQLIGAFWLLHSMDTTLAWMLLIMTPLAVVLGKFISRRLRAMTLRIRSDESRIQMQIQESMELNAVLRALSSESWMTDRLDGMQHQLHGNIMHRARFTVIMRIILGAAFGLGYMLAFIWGGLQLRSGAITFGVMTSFLQLVAQIQQPILTLINMMTQAFHATASIDRLKELEQTDDVPQRPSDTVESPAHPLPLGIKARDVNFHYASGDRMVLEHFTHDFLPGTKTALMGPTGIGKTTLFRLLLSLVRPDSGSLAIYDETGETPVSEATRSRFVFVPQGNTLMSGSIRYNLLIARPDATDEELRKVLHTAVADFVFDLPDGIDTELSEHGGGVSEGQAQRIAIARGLLRPGNILLLDEISASLDEQTERTLYSRLFSEYPEKTMVFITHRPTISQLCTDIIRFE